MPTKYRQFGVITPKVLLVTEYPLPNGQSLLAVNVHLLNFERWSVIKIRHQLEDLKFIITHHSGPILMAGDFNTWNQKRLQLIEGIKKDIILQEVIDFPSGPTTADMRLAGLNRLLGIKKDFPLDRIYQRGFISHSAKVLAYDSSDHKPILVTLTRKTR